MKAIYYTVSLLMLLLAVLITPAVAKDISGSRDHDLVKRYEGSDIIKYNHNSFDAYTIAVGPSKNAGTLTDVLDIEGAVTRLTYKAPVGRSVLEVVRNYENELKDQGFQVVYQGAKDRLGKGFAEAAGYRKVQMPPNIPIFYLNEDTQRYMVLERKSEEKGNVYVVLFGVEEEFWASDLKDVAKGQVLIQVDVIETKPMEKKMVTVTADEIAQQVAASGGVALYGIYFDFNKADLKPESQPTLKEMAAFLKSNQDKFLVVGHTDSIGSYDSNLTLSQRRAESVVKALAGQYGIQSSRLTPIGVAFACPKATNRTEDGRSKNRRVELVEYAHE